MLRQVPLPPAAQGVLSILAAVALCLYGTITGVADAKAYADFRPHAVETAAVVTSTASHMGAMRTPSYVIFDYAYDVAGLRYYGEARASLRNAPAEGDRIAVAYDARSPAYSEIEDIDKRHQREYFVRFFLIGVAVPLALLLFAAFAFQIGRPSLPPRNDPL